MLKAFLNLFFLMVYWWLGAKYHQNFWHNSRNSK